MVLGSLGIFAGAAASAGAAPPDPPAAPETSTTTTTAATPPGAVPGDAQSGSAASEPSLPGRAESAAPSLPTTPDANPIAAPDAAALAAAGQPAAAASLPADEDLGDYGPTPPPPEFSDAAVNSGASSTASPALAGTGALSNRLARMGVILALAGILFVVADLSERSRAVFAWAYRSPTRRSRDLDDLLPRRSARVRATSSPR